MEKICDDTIKKLEEELLLLINRRLFEKGAISKTMYEGAKSIIVTGEK